MAEKEEKVEETNIFVLDVLEKFELTISAFGEDGRAEGLHDLLDSNGCTCELVLCRTGEAMCRGSRGCGEETYHTSPNAPGEGERGVAEGLRGMTHPCQRVGDRHILWLPEIG